MTATVVEKNHGPLSRELLKQGCPTGLRAVIWRQVLGLDITDKVGNCKIYFFMYWGKERYAVFYLSDVLPLSNEMINE